MTITRSFEKLEEKRIALQQELDGAKTQAERNRLGQFATPAVLAKDILEYGSGLLSPKAKIRFVDPAFGTGAFFAALHATVPASRIEDATGFEIDPHYARPTLNLWKQSGLRLKVADFTKEPPRPKANLLICNPPYVRHHHLSREDKGRLQLATANASGIKIAGLSGLYCYFLGLSHAWMAEGAIAGWLIPSEFMDVNYGRALKQYLLNKITLLHIHRFDPNEVQFGDALVSSAVVWFRNSPPPPSHSVKFTFGGTLSAPRRTRMVSASALAQEAKWTRFPLAHVRQRTSGPILSDLFRIKRGIATGNNDYFILSADEIAQHKLPREVFRPILPSPRYVPEDEVISDVAGNPIIDRCLFLLDPKLSESEIETRFPQLHIYLERGKAKGLHERYLCNHRSPWYRQENRPAAPIVCTYLGRSDTKSGRPFRFILNHSAATVANVYLALYPTAELARHLTSDPQLLRKIWQYLNQIAPDKLLGEGRVYGGGLHKLEPKELANVPIPGLVEFLPHQRPVTIQSELFPAVAAAE